MLPWINAAALDQRRAFIAAYLTGHDSIADLARRFGVSHKTAHKFVLVRRIYVSERVHGRAWFTAYETASLR